MPANVFSRELLRPIHTGFVVTNSSTTHRTAPAVSCFPPGSLVSIESVNSFYDHLAFEYYCFCLLRIPHLFVTRSISQ